MPDFNSFCTAMGTAIEEGGKFLAKILRLLISKEVTFQHAEIISKHVMTFMNKNVFFVTSTLFARNLEITNAIYTVHN